MRIGVGIALIVALASSAALADAVRLKNGTRLDGTIVSEDDKQLTMEVEYASGTIIQTETFNKTNVAEITRLTPEQRDAREMEMAHQRLQRYQLDPKSSAAESYYDGAIRAFKRFQQEYPNSAYTNELADKLLQWQEERDKVASGMVKVHGEWTTRAPSSQQVVSAASSRPATAAPPAVVKTSAPPPAAPVGDTAVLSETSNWFKRYWGYGVVAVLVGLWLVVRLFTKQ